jgi:hypothetical protein
MSEGEKRTFDVADFEDEYSETVQTTVSGLKDAITRCYVMDNDVYVYRNRDSGALLVTTRWKDVDGSNFDEIGGLNYEWVELVPRRELIDRYVSRFLNEIKKMR